MSKILLRHTLIKKIFLTFLLTPHLYTFSLYEKPSFIIFSAETEYISTRSWYRNKQSDGLVERFNHTIEDMLSKAVRCGQRNWDENFPLLMLAYRCSEHKNIAFTPGIMMFGREVELQYPVGSLLWLHDITRKRGLCRKLQLHGKALAK
jgi:hypothetical protein